MIKRFLRCSRGTAAVEAAIFTPVFLLFTIGITDLGASMYNRMQVNAATQAGAMYGVINSDTGQTCETLTPACSSAIQKVINDATGNESFCSTYTCTPSIGTCSVDGGSKCIKVTVEYPYTPILPYAVYSWAQSETISSISTIRAF